MVEVEKKGIDKARVVLTVFVILAIMLTASNILVYVNLKNQIDTLETDNTTLHGQMDTLQTEKSSLQTQVGNLQTDKSTLEDEVNSLQTEKDRLEDQVSSLQTAKNTLEDQMNTLQAENSQLQSEVDSLQSEILDLELEISDLKREIEWLRQIAEEDNFQFYYASLAKQRFGVYDLDEYLDRWEWIEGTYVEGVFDCSEMSAYIEWRLENEGYHTYIVCGESPWGGGYHAWLLVETSEGAYMPVEATEYEVVWWSNPYFDNYFEYDYLFETIHDALDYSYGEFDWWN